MQNMVSDTARFIFSLMSGMRIGLFLTLKVVKSAPL